MTGNPTYPLLYKVFDGPKWDEVRDARFARAHSAGGVGGKEFGLAAGGYPGEYANGQPISGLEQMESEDAKIFHAGTQLQGDSVVTSVKCYS